MRNLLYFIVFAVAIFANVPVTCHAAINDGLISVWSFDEGAGTYTEDQAGNNHGIFLEGGATGLPPSWISPGKLGGSMLEFDTSAANEYVPQGVLLNTDGMLDSYEVPASLMPTSAISVSAWVKAKTFAYYAPVIYNAMWTSNIQSGYMIHTYNGFFNWWLKPDGGNYGIITYAGNVDQWYHLVGTYDGSLTTKDQLKFYVNGVLEGSLRVSGPIDWDPVPFNCLIGAYNDDNESYTFDGQLDDVAVWDRALTLEEIGWIYNNGIGNAIPGQPLIPTPSNRAELIDCEQDLSWELVWDNLTVLGYDVYFGTDPNEENPTWYGNNKVVDNKLVTSCDPDTLENDTTYYWRVDIIEPNDLGGTWTRTGRTWQFSTCPLDVVILQQPEVQVVPVGDSAILTVETMNAVSYQWYKQGEPDLILVSDGSKIIGSQTETLTITDFQVADEGFYFCVMQDSIGGSKETDHVIAVTEKIIGYWPMDGDFLDYSGLGNDGTAVGDPNFVTGLVGSDSLYLKGDNYVVIDPVADDIPTNDITLSGWVKTSDLNADWFTCNTADGGNVALFEIWGGYVNLFEAGVSEAWSETMVSDDQWHLLTYTRNGSTGSVYVDGSLENMHTANFNFSPDNLWSIGQEWDWDTDNQELVPSDYLTGHVDDIRIYNYALDMYEVAGLYLDVYLNDSVCLEKIEMDLDNNCKINIGDFAIVAEAWLECNIVPSCIP